MTRGTALTHSPRFVLELEKGKGEDPPPPTGFLSKHSLQRLLDQNPVGIYGKMLHMTLFGPIRIPCPKGLNCWFTPL